jgi:hypothetical protein
MRSHPQGTGIGRRGSATQATRFSSWRECLINFSPVGIKELILENLIHRLIALQNPPCQEEGKI